MRHNVINRVKRGFTLIEILIVVVILGILAAIVIPQFTDAAEDAQLASAQSTIQTIRGQVELFNVQTGGYPTFAGGAWTELTTANYLQGEPRNSMRNNATAIASGTAAPGAASGGVATDGWYWNTANEIMYIIDDAGLVMNW